MAEIEAFTPDEAMAYEESLKRMRDYNNTLKTAKDDGIAEGETRKAIQIAQNLKSLGANTEYISKATGLSKEEIESL